MKKIAIVTGASRGIGAATVKKLAEVDYAVCVNYCHKRKEAENIAADIIKHGGEAIAVQADVSAEADILRLFTTVDKELGTLTALVNNAAGFYTGGIRDMAWDDIDLLFRTNVFGTFIACREAIKRMEQGGAIVNVSSEAGRFGGNKMTAYAASKAAINTFTIGFAREAAAQNIRVNAISPGVIDTDAHADATAERLAALNASIPLGRIGTPGEVANTIAWLLSEEASYVSGTILSVAGGR